MKKIALLLFILLSITLINSQPPSTFVTLERGVDIVHPETAYVEYGKDLEFNFWTYNSTTGQTLTNSSLNCTLYLIDNKGINFWRFSSQAGGSGLITYGKGLPLCVNCWTMTMPKENLSIGLYSYQIKCQGLETGGYYTGFFDVTTTGQIVSLSNIILCISLLILGIIIFMIGNTFKPEQYILRTSFYIFCILFLLLGLNSARIIASESYDLNLMANIGIILNIVIFLFMLLLVFIYWTIQTFKQVKEKQGVRWNY